MVAPFGFIEHLLKFVKLMQTNTSLDYFVTDNGAKSTGISLNFQTVRQIIITENARKMRLSR